jgi:hypothetical protein
MIQKHSNNRRSGRAQNHQEQKRRGRSGVQQRVCSLFFFPTWRGLFTVNFFLLTIRSTLASIVTFWDAWENVRRKKTGTLVQPQLAPSSQRARPHVPENQFVTNNMVIVLHPPYSPDLAPWFRFVSQIENGTERTTFWNSVWHPMGIASGTRQHQGMTSTVLLKRGKTMGSLYTFPRILLWRRQPKLSKLSQHFFIYLVWEISNTPRTDGLMEIYEVRLELNSDPMIWGAAIK